MPLIIFKPENQNPSRRGAQRYDGIQLNPGTNQVPGEIYERLQGHPGFQADLNLGAIAIASEPEVKPPVRSAISDVPIDQLDEVLAGVYDVAQVDDWLASEHRVTAIKKLNRRRSEIEAGV